VSVSVVESISAARRPGCRTKAQVADESLAEDFPMLGFGRAAVPRCASLQTGNQTVIQIADMQIPSHPAFHEIIALNDLT
jgi:hypothetical protein